ncbi:N-acetylmuramoyl-L-alanine amidase [Rhodobacteraceae bacterium CCMM004]|nr:N-acetylmuramoyl-L-alanine amidase [Rhodobacteraceae bacterium CCMM004]
MTPIWHPSPNAGPRRGGARPDLVVIHYTAMATAEAALERLCDPAAEVSSHHLICSRGTVWTLVDEADRAWHAGAGAWGAVRDVNSRSIGIELANDGQSPFAAPQMAALEALLAGAVERWGIRPERIIGHSDCAPGRKTDPGPRFDWRRLAGRGLAVWPEAPQEASDMDDAAFVDALRRAGYTASADPATLLAALRLRFRPGAEGPRDARDVGVAHWLAHSFPVDAAPQPA